MSTRNSGLRERRTFFAYFGWSESLDFGILQIRVVAGERATMSGVRRTT